MREIVARGGPAPAAAVVEDGKLVEYVEDESSAIADAVILGKVARVVPGLRAAFVDIGEEKNGFLPLEEKKLSQDAQYRGISESVQSGDRVLVQVRREAMGTKGAFLSRDLSITGSYVILMPRNNMIGVSARITSDSRREELKELGKTISEGRFGLVMRTSSEDAEEELIRSEANALLAAWNQIEKLASTAHAPSVIFKNPSSVDALLTDYLPRGIDCITTNEQRIFDRYHAETETRLVPEDPIAARGLDAECLHALERRVWLKSGGNLVIDECEALTVIDVNTAKDTGNRQDRQALLHTNLEACSEIARQIRLRNLGGIILIDMIDMQTDEERQMILGALHEALQKDRVKTVVHGFTSLGLLEMTRRRSHRRIRELLAQPCPVCRGAGMIYKKRDLTKGETSCPKETDNS